MDRLVDRASTLSSILNALPVHIALVDHDGVIIAINEGWRRFAHGNDLRTPLFGMGANYLEVCEAATGECSAEAGAAARGIRSVLSGQAPDFSLEYPCHSPSESRWFRLIVNRLADDAEGAAVVMHADITKRRLAEGALRESEELFRGTFEQAAVGIAHSSPDGTFIQVNDKLCALGGYPREVLLGRSFHDLVHPDDRDAVETARVEMIDGVRASYSAEIRYFRSDGEISWANIIVTPTRNDSGETKYFISVVEDITARKRAESALHASEQQFASAFEYAAIGVALVSPDGRWLKVNRALCRMLGYSETEMLARTVQDITHPDDLDSDLERARRLLAGDDDSYQVEKRYFHRRGHLVWVLLNVSIVRDHDGKPVHFISQVQDITEKRRSREAILLQAQMLDQIGQAVIATDPQGVVIYTNSFASDLYGWPQDEMLGENIMKITVADLSHDRAAEIMDDLVKGQTWSGEMLLQNRQGRVFPAFITNTPLLDDEGRLVGVIGVSIDISVRKEAEEAVERNEREQRKLAQELEAERARLVIAQAVASMGSWEIDLSTRDVIWSDEAHRIFGTRPEERVTYRGFLDLVHPDDRKMVTDAYAHSIISRDSCSLEHRILLPGGRIKYIDERWQVFTGEDGQPQRIVGTAHDITDRKLADARIREQASMIDEATDAILVRDLEGRITYWNRGAATLYGWSAEEAIGQSARDLLHSEPAAFNDATTLVLSDGAWSGELKKTTRTGDEVTVDARWTLLRDEIGAPKSVLSINTDVTERRKLEAQFFRAQRMESIGTLAGGIAHDLNNLLAPIVMAVSVLKKFEKREKMLAVLTNIERSAKRGTELVKQVLSFGRGIEGSRVPVRLVDITSEIEAIISSTFPKNIILEEDLASDLQLVVGDPTQLNQVLLNLCVNARDAMPDGGRLMISGKNASIDEQYASMNRGVSAGRYVVLSVADEGCGMPKEVMDRVFDPFFTTKDTGKGTGLGLSTVSGIVRSHSGFINVHSEVGVGSVFRIYLPAAAELHGPVIVPGNAELLPRGRGELILVVDDEASIRGVTAQTLEAFGYRVIVAEDGAQAIGLYAMRRDEIALVLTDMMMPVMDGPALIAALHRINPQVRIIAASGLGANDSIAKASHAGVVHFLAKPFSADAMLTLLRKALSEETLGGGPGW